MEMILCLFLICFNIWLGFGVYMLGNIYYELNALNEELKNRKTLGRY